MLNSNPATLFCKWQKWSSFFSRPVEPASIPFSLLSAFGLISKVIYFQTQRKLNQCDQTLELKAAQFSLKRPKK